MTPWKLTAVANTPGLMLPADPGRNGARIQNPFTFPIWIDRVASPLSGEPSLYIAPADASGHRGWYVFDGYCGEAWYYVTAGAGDFGGHTW